MTVSGERNVQRGDHEKLKRICDARNKKGGKAAPQSEEIRTLRMLTFMAKLHRIYRQLFHSRSRSREALPMQNGFYYWGGFGRFRTGFSPEAGGGILAAAGLARLLGGGGGGRGATSGCSI